MSIKKIINRLVFLRKHISAVHVLLLGFLLFILQKSSLLFHTRELLWDEAVYLSMGRYIYTFGETGLWEPLRPPILPIVLGFFDLFGDPVFLGKLFILFCALAGATLLYLLLKERVDPGIAASAALILLFTPIWFSSSSNLLTGIPSVTLALGAIYAYAKQKYFLSGILAAIAFLIRFPTGLILAALLGTQLILLVKTRTRIIYTQTIFLLLGFSSLVLPWMIINAIQYQHTGLIAPIYPLISGGVNVFFDHLWLRTSGIEYYFIGILVTLPIIIFAVFSIDKKAYTPEAIAIVLFGALGLMFYTILPNNQWRFALIFIPTLIWLVAVGMHRIHHTRQWLYPLLICCVLVQLILFIPPNHEHIQHQKQELSSFYKDHFQYASTHEPLQGMMYVTNPIAAWYTGGFAKQIYYEFYTEIHLEDDMPEIVFFAPRHIPCQHDDINCQEALYSFVTELREHYTLVQENQRYGYAYFIFLRETTLPGIDTERVFSQLRYVQYNPPVMQEQSFLTQ